MLGEMRGVKFLTSNHIRPADMRCLLCSNRTIIRNGIGYRWIFLGIDGITLP